MDLGQRCDDSTVPTAGWVEFLRTARGLSGDLCINANLTCDNEYDHRFALCDAHQFDVTRMHDDDKLVIWIHP